MAMLRVLALLHVARALDLADPCVKAGGIHCSPAQARVATTTTLPAPPSYRLIRANGSVHIYFQVIAGAQKHLVRLGLCRVCDRPEVCKTVVVMDPAYVDGLETSSDFVCDMLDADASDASSASPWMGTDTIKVSNAQLPVSWMVAIAAISAWLLCSVVIGVAVCRRSGKRAKRGVALQDAQAYSPVPHAFLQQLPAPGAQAPKTGWGSTEPWMLQDLDLVTVTPQGYEVRPTNASEVKANGARYFPTVDASPAAYAPLQMSSRVPSLEPTSPPAAGQLLPVMPGAAGVASVLTSIVGPPDNLPVQPAPRTTGSLRH